MPSGPSKYDWPVSQFKEHLPIWLAERFVKTFPGLIEIKLDELGPDSLVKYAGSYAKEPMGRWLVRYSGFTQRVIMSLQNGSALEQDLLAVLREQDARLIPTRDPRATHWQKLRGRDPEHPVFEDPLWNISLSERMVHSLGEHISTTDWWKRHAPYIRREVSMLKTVKRVMES